MVELVRGGLAAANVERVVARGRTIEDMRITDAGRRACTA
jgi:hypothetical protein